MGKSSDSASANVLISIYQEYAEAILRGNKVIEFRKAQFPDHVTRVFLYSTSPIKRVIGHFEVEEVIRTTPKNLWSRYGRRGAIGCEDFFRYYGDSEEACGILVKNPVRYSRPLELKELDSSITVPQSFCYLNEDMLESLEKRRLVPNGFGYIFSWFPFLKKIKSIPDMLKATMNLM